MESAAQDRGKKLTRMGKERVASARYERRPLAWIDSLRTVSCMETSGVGGNVSIRSSNLVRIDEVGNSLRSDLSIRRGGLLAGFDASSAFLN